jgi:hypothetical protein
MMMRLSERVRAFFKHRQTEADLKLLRVHAELALERAFVEGYRQGFEDGCAHGGKPECERKEGAEG